MSRAPKFTDKRAKYRTADESKQPGYLERRFRAYRRLQRMKNRLKIVKKVANGSS